MAEVIVGHPSAGFSGYVRVAGRGLFFHQGFTYLVDLSTAQQAAVTAAGYAVGATPPTPQPDPFPQYLERADLVDAIGSPSDEVALALRAAFGSPDDVGFDLVLLLGQSNMSGRGTPYDARTDPVDGRVFQYGASGTYASVVSQAVEPLAMHDTPTGIGPGLGFARWYAASIPTNRRVLLVPAAHGGTPLSTAVTPLGWRRGVSGNLYAQALAQATAAFAAAGANARIVAALWLQGESDGDLDTPGASYQTDLDALISGLRTDLGVANLPFIVGQMVPEYLSTGSRTAINAVHAATPSRVTRTAFARGPIGQSLNDGNHYNAAAQRTIGRRMFDAYRRIITGATEPALPSALGQVTGVGSAVNGNSVAISWTALSGAEGYVVEYRVTGSSTWIRGATVTGTAAAVNGLNATTGYDVRVTGVNAAGPGAASAVATFTSPAISDTFTRADTTAGLGTADTGQAWSPLSGAFGISSGQAYLVTGSPLSVINSGKSDCTVTAALATLGDAGNNALSRLIFRCQDANNFWMLQHRATTAKYQLYKCVGGTFTQVGADLATTPAAGDSLSAVLAGSSITVKINGSTAATATDSALATATSHGLMLTAGSAPGVARMDNFTIA